MQLLGHKDIRMSLQYIQVTQQDLHRQYHLARQNAALNRLSTRIRILEKDLRNLEGKGGKKIRS
jgi:tRNA1(Val) A37 N6-methylase TrmN6